MSEKHLQDNYLENKCNENLDVLDLMPDTFFLNISKTMGLDKSDELTKSSTVELLEKIFNSEHYLYDLDNFIESYIYSLELYVKFDNGSSDCIQNVLKHAPIIHLLNHIKEKKRLDSLGLKKKINDIMDPSSK